ncbi:hypothetical protein GCM10023354_01510 [Garicola koreensis]
MGHQGEVQIHSPAFEPEQVLTVGGALACWGAQQLGQELHSRADLLGDPGEQVRRLGMAGSVQHWVSASLAVGL